MDRMEEPEGKGAPGWALLDAWDGMGVVEGNKAWGIIIALHCIVYD